MKIHKHRIRSVDEDRRIRSWLKRQRMPPSQQKRSETVGGGSKSRLGAEPETLGRHRGLVERYCQRALHGL